MRIYVRTYVWWRRVKRRASVVMVGVGANEFWIIHPQFIPVRHMLMPPVVMCALTSTRRHTAHLAYPVSVLILHPVVTGAYKTRV